MSTDNLHQFDNKDLKVIKRERLYEGFFQLDRVYFQHKLFAGGESAVIIRELLYKGEAAALIAYDPEQDSVVLVEQVRIGAFVENSHASPWLFELIAGMVEPTETAIEVAKREAFEEAGIQVTDLQHALSVWDSPGGVVERIHLFVGKVDASTAKGLHGLASEGEDIKVHVVDRTQAYQWVQNGTIDNTIAVIGLQWLQLNIKYLQKQWLSE